VNTSTHVALPFAMSIALMTGCSKPPADDLPDDPDELTLYSIDGTGTWRGPTKGPPLYDHPVLGWVEITDPGQRREIMAAVKDAIRAAPTDGKPMACWMPRHLLRMTKDGKAADLLICFECHSYGIRWRDSSGGKRGRILPDGQPPLDRILAGAGVPAVPKLE